MYEYIHTFTHIYGLSQASFNVIQNKISNYLNFIIHFAINKSYWKATAIDFALSKIHQFANFLSKISWHELHLIFRFIIRISVLTPLMKRHLPWTKMNKMNIHVFCALSVSPWHPTFLSKEILSSYIFSV